MRLGKLCGPETRYPITSGHTSTLSQHRHAWLLLTTITTATAKARVKRKITLENTVQVIAYIKKGRE